VDYADGFGLIRGSNTTPVLVLRFEGHTEAALHRIENDFMAALRAVKPDAKVQQAAH
ncbi:MAG TPA: phosphomannomutase/phosphoglucomutase, partial [Methylibium sp.]|nr:phosphomannomutase/phosphoglucomutase [Methylibium sp.]